jgi:hypothetical protein
MRRRVALGLSLAAALSLATPAGARILMSQQQALSLAFPPGTDVQRETFFLDAAQLAAAKRLAGEELHQELVVRYAGRRGGRVVGYAYFDAHRVRTLTETLMFVLSPDGRIERVELLSFLEPEDYLPRRRWLDQLDGRALDQELSLNRAIRPLSGASLTSQAVVKASRRVLALHQVLGGPPGGAISR